MADQTLEVDGVPSEDVMGLVGPLNRPGSTAPRRFWFAMVQDNRTMDAENRRTQAELRLAEQRAQAEALQAYHDEMATLMLNRNLQDSEQGGPVFTLAQARTTVVMERLDSEDNRSVTRFLTDSSLGRNSKVLYKSSSQRVSTGR